MTIKKKHGLRRLINYSMLFCLLVYIIIDCFDREEVSEFSTVSIEIIDTDSNQTIHTEYIEIEKYKVGNEGHRISFSVDNLNFEYYEEQIELTLGPIQIVERVSFGNTLWAFTLLALILLSITLDFLNNAEYKVYELDVKIRKRTEDWRNALDGSMATGNSVDINNGSFHSDSRTD